MVKTATVRVLFLLVLWALLPALVPTAGAQASRADRVALARAEGVFATDAVSGVLEVEAVFVLRALTETGTQQGTLEVLVDLAPLADAEQPPVAEGRWLGVSMVVGTRGGPTRVAHAELAVGGLGRAEHWSFEAAMELPGDLRDAVVVVEEPFSGVWGAAVVEVSDERLEVPAGTSFSVRPGVWSLTGEVTAEAGGETGPAGPAPSPAAGGAPSPPPAAGAPAPSVPAPPAPATASSVPPAPAAAAPLAPRGTVLRLLPPRGRSLEGAVRFDTLVSDPDVAKVVFSLDGETVATVDKEPFDARLTLAGPGTPQVVLAQAYSATGDLVGADEVTVNDPVRSFRVRLARVEGDPAGGSLEIEAEVSVPAQARLDRVEVYWNETLAARLESPPFTARIDTAGASGQDFVRVAAFLDDGTSVEDVRLLTAGGVVEEVDVNLVELYAVVTDKSGRPVRDLGRDDFQVRQRRKPVRLERVTYAEDVPLSLGLVIDTSASMQFILTETKQAATQFLSQVLGDGDRAFVVDFSTRPRLRQRSTGDILELVGSFRGMQAEGYTALFDAVIFSLLEFTDGPGRRALVMLTDGDDYKSRFGPNRAVQYARRMGVPVYLIALGGPQAIRGSTRMELETVTGETGGRLYFAEDISQLPRVYEEINAELRSQYLLTYYTESELTDDERRSVDLQVRGRGLEARAVVSAD